jgi:hypothetical protein
MPSSPYRTAARPAPRPRPEAPLDVAGMAALVWILTAVRLTMSVVHAEAPSRELALAWLVLIALPVLAGRAIAERRRAR